MTIFDLIRSRVMPSNHPGRENLAPLTNQTPAAWQPVDPAGDAYTWAAILSSDPLVIHTKPSMEFPLGSASALGSLLRQRKAHFLVTPSWTAEPPNHESLLAVMRSYAADHPLHRLTFLGNTDRETRAVADAGFEALTLNQNCFVNDAVFRPLPDILPIYDAVYNARLSPFKRSELASETERLALIFFTTPPATRCRSFTRSTHVWAPSCRTLLS